MDRGTADLVVKVGMFLLGAIGSWKLVVEFWRARRSHLREDYRFAREFFIDLAAAPNMHPFLKQKGYQAIAGEESLSADETEYLLTLHDPVRALRNYVLGRKYLEFRSTSAAAKLDFKPKYKNKWSRAWRKFSYAALYFVCYMIGVSPLFLPGLKLLSPASVPLAFLITAPLFLPAGFYAITAGIRISRAEELARNQNKHGSPAIHIVEKVVA